MIPLFHVKSDSNDTVYEVYYSWRKGWLCQCMDWYMRVCHHEDVKCKHVKKVLAVLQGDHLQTPEVKALSSV